ncbi:MAG TPA: FecR domain-containing protein [Methylophilaceae bacterium]|jgi:transmembrane sensor
MKQNNHQVKNIDAATKQAADWFALLSSGSATDQDKQAWHTWRTSDTKNDQTWQLLEKVTSQFKQFPENQEINNSLQRLYDRPDSGNKRVFLKQLSMLFVVGSASYFAYREQPWQTLLADHATATGERKDVALADGTKLWMNTNTVVDVQFTDKQRIITLIKGEILVETGHEHQANYRPFVVKTQHGSATALGTKFSVRDFKRYSHVSVFEGTVKVIPNDNMNSTLTIKAGESANFSASEITEHAISDVSTVAWIHGFVIADNTALGDFITELSRYRSGFLRCDPAISQLKISGSYSIDDIDLTLNVLSRKFPIHVQTLTRYWTNLTRL